MTEYDFSPEAYERHLATQNRIARWVDATTHQHLRNPFTPATPASPVHHPLPPLHRPHHSRHHSSHSPSRSRPPPTRSQTSPAPPTSRRRDDSVHRTSASSSVRHSSRDSSTTRPRSHTHSHSTPFLPQHPPYTPQHTRRDPVRAYTTPAPRYSLDNHVTYIYTSPVSPTKPRNFDIAAAPQLPYSAYQSNKQQPLLKRLFSGLKSATKPRTHKRRTSY